MARVCFSMLFLLMLTACAADQGKQQDVFYLNAQRMLACTGVPVAGKTCLLDDPKEEASKSEAHG
jgi:hypothetical protein